MGASEVTLGKKQYVDIHCHCLPGIDDGPSTMLEAIELCRALVHDGIGTVIATPHQLGRFDNTNNAAQIREAVGMMNQHLHETNIDLQILPGADVRVDERICELLEADKVMTLCDGGKYLLLELPSQVFIEIDSLLVELNQRGISVIISHPERYRMVAQKPEVLEKWLEHGASLQITAGSLLGHLGSTAQKSAWSFLKRGWAQFVATDAHDTQQRIPCMTAAFERIEIELGPQIAREVCIENPMRIIEGVDLPNVYQTSSMGVSSWGLRQLTPTEKSIP